MFARAPHGPSVLLSLTSLALCLACGASKDASPFQEAAAPDTAGDLVDVAHLAPSCPTLFTNDPLSGLAPGAFPDDLYTEDDPTSPTGLRVRLDAQRAPWLAALPPAQALAFSQLDGLDGFGTSAAVLLPFDAPLDPASLDAVRLLDLDAGASPDVDVEIMLIPPGDLLLVRPRAPLRPGKRYGVIASCDLHDADGGCVGSSQALNTLLRGGTEEPRLARLAPRYARLLEIAGLGASEVAAAVVFTTQTILEHSEPVVDDLTSRTYRWTEAPACEERDDFQRCEGAFEAWDYRGAGGVGAPPSRAYTLPVSLWLPRAQAKPWPVMLFGHGAGESRTNGAYLARHVCPLGVAVLAVDAVGFGDHPDSAGGEALLSVCALMGVDLDAGTLDARAMRANLRQTSYDKLQLIHLTRGAPDLDGDGAPDLDPGRLAYAGFSLGGITAGEVLARAPVALALLSVTGARVTSIIDGGLWETLLLPQILPVGTPEAEERRFLEAVQAVVDGADSVSFAPYVLSERLHAEPAPHLLFNMAMGDTYVANTSSLAYAQALRIPQVAPVALPVPGAEILTGPTVHGNLNDGAVTAALFQYDRVTEAEGQPPAPAGHDSTPVSREAVLQVTRFVETWLAGEVPEIVDPYAVLGTPPL
jgi:dienelactone hydrolase